ncbi:MAG TPA: hypothetical protein VF884_15015 [Nitrososphaeraceae archaeon]
MLLIQKSWPVFIYAITISAESIIIEFLTLSLQLPPILLSATSITVGGLMLLLVRFFLLQREKKVAIRREVVIFSQSTKNLILTSLSLAVGVFSWYDSIGRVGASKEIILAGPLEVVLIVILARIILKEKLDKIYVTGCTVAITGFFMAILSNMSSIDTLQNPTSAILSLGDIEAIISAFGFAIAVLFLTKLVSVHSSIEVAGAALFLAGLIIFGFLILFYFYEIVGSISELSTSEIAKTLGILILFSVLPFIGALSYAVGLSKIGAALTGTIGASSILITLAAQILLREYGLMSSYLPENIILAILGAILGFMGILIVHMHDYYFSTIDKKS